MDAERFPCPCCGYLSLSSGPGDWEICRVCGWEDDLTQLRWVTMGPGANRLSLMDAQAAFVPPSPAPDFRRDPKWRPLDPAIDSIEVPTPGVDYGATYPDDRTYYWYWRRD